ncbi:MAG: hypothetical protein JHD15_06705 [Phenylobacterium sp.]|jgi:hypothetical protein|uniref:hypothetical protein n=1 Tax=unclassified Phenylobacterium TaxID=2640670 RepID=UPI0008D5D2BF|nr:MULTISPECIES: hypothetical protein [unclassified Phenylobacterium]MBJ7410043.1 hypothetical protein [Phenylobacterium sp.]OHB29518.1 MAG: hypothetical protein A2790_06235 [Phenylobacterium sp. RIFCSPHIGHO2_01_FULL_69_31]
MPSFSYVNEQPQESIVVIRPWDYAAKVLTGGRVDIRFESTGVEKPEIVVTHRAGGEIEIGLGVNIVSISGERVESLSPRPDDPVP